MSHAYESLVFHDAPRDELRVIVDAVATRLQRTVGWARVAADVPDAVGLRAPLSVRSWGERITLAVEESSIRIVSESVAIPQITDWGKNRANVARVRRLLRRELAAPQNGLTYPDEAI